MAHPEWSRRDTGHIIGRPFQAKAVESAKFLSFPPLKFVQEVIRPSQDDEDTSSMNEDDNYNDADKVEEAIRRLEKHVTISGAASRPSASQPNSLAGSQPGSQPHSQPGQ
jgi:hypothetical protein